MKILQWLCDYWYIPVFALGVWVAKLWANKTKNRWGLKKELRVIEEGRQTRQVEIELGATEALQHVRDNYLKERAELNLADQKKAKALEDDPVALTRFLLRVSQ